MEKKPSDFANKWLPTRNNNPAENAGWVDSGGIHRGMDEDENDTSVLLLACERECKY